MNTKAIFAFSIYTNGQPVWRCRALRKKRGL